MPVVVQRLVQRLVQRVEEPEWEPAAQARVRPQPAAIRRTNSGTMARALVAEPLRQQPVPSGTAMPAGEPAMGSPPQRGLLSRPAATARQPRSRNPGAPKSGKGIPLPCASQEDGWPSDHPGGSLRSPPRMGSPFSLRTHLPVQMGWKREPIHLRSEGFG